jgi:hypothetical protein
MSRFKGKWAKHGHSDQEVDSFDRKARKNKKRGKPRQEDPFEDHHRIRLEDIDLEEDEIPPHTD